MMLYDKETIMNAQGNARNTTVIIIVAVVLIGVAAYLSFGRSGTANTVDRTGSIVQNTNDGANVNVNADSNGNVNAYINGSVALNENLNGNMVPPELTYEEELYMEASTDWKTYANADIGYSVKYPKDWTVEDTVQTRSEQLVSPVRYITLFSPSKSHFLTLGVKRSTDEFLISNRTGVGAGEIVADGTVTVADTSLPASKLVYKGKVKEWYAAKNGPGQSTVGTQVINAALSVGNVSDYASIDLAGSPELSTAKVILSMLTFIK